MENIPKESYAFFYTPPKVSHMNRFFQEADESGDGYVTLAEWQEMVKDPRVKTWLSAMVIYK